MGKPAVQYIEHNGRKLDQGAILDHVQTVIFYKETIPVRDVISGVGGDPNSSQGCTIMYHVGDDRWKRRTLQPGHSFNFGWDIIEIHFRDEITELSAYDKIFGFMDTTDKFLVSKDLFGNPERVGDAHLTLEFTSPDNRKHRQRQQQGKYFEFKGTSGDPIEPPPKRPQPGPGPGPVPPPNPCLCPCPLCAKGHLTDEQRKEREEQQKKEEQDRRAQLEDLKESISRAHELARNAATTAEQALHDVKEAQGDIRNIYRELADIRAVLGNLGSGGDRKWEIPPLFKVCIVSSQILALIVLGDYTWRAIIQGKRA